MATKEFTAEGLAAGVEITGSNQGASGDVLTPVKGTGSLVGTVTAGEVIFGDASLKSTAASGTYAYGMFNAENLSVFGFRAYFRFLSLPTVNTDFMVITSGTGTTNLVRLMINSTGKVYVLDATGSTILYTTPSALTTNTVYGFDLTAQIGTTTTDGKVRFAVYDAAGNYGAGMSSVYTNTTCNMGTANAFRFSVGKYTTAATAWSAIIDSVKKTDSYALVGPETSTSSGYLAVINGGSKLDLRPGTSRALSAAGSSGNPTAYEWTRISGQQVTISNAGSGTASYEVPTTTTDTTTTIQLRVGDGTTWSAPVTVTDTISKHPIWFMKSGTLTAGSFHATSLLSATTVSTSNVTDTSATLTWTTVAGATGYLVGRDGVDSNGNGAYQTTDASSKTSRTFINLNPGTTYTLFCEPQPGGQRKSITITTDTAASTGYVRPTGSAYTPYESLTVRGTATGTGPNGRLSATVNGVSTLSKVTFAPGTFEFYDFRDPTVFPVYGVYFQGGKANEIDGSGIDSTIFQMHPNSSTQASQVPLQSAGGTNPLSLMRADSAPSGNGPFLAGFTLLATDQGHKYNGLLLNYPNNAVLSNLKVQGMPGDNAANPGETFGINDYRGVNTTFINVEVDGRDPSTGTRVGGSNIGLNFTSGFTTTDVYSHGVGYGSGITHFYCTSGIISHTRFRSEDNDIPYNFERCACTINMYNCTSKNNRSKTTSGTISPIFAVVDSDTGSSVMNIYDPRIDDGNGNLVTPSPSYPLIIVIHATYPFQGGANKQLSSDIHLFLSGVERADCLRFATNETLVYG